MRPAKKSQAIHNFRRCTALQRAQTLPLGSCSAEAPLLAPPEGDTHLHTGCGGKTGSWWNGTGWSRKHHGSQELLVGKVLLIIAESRVVNKGTGTASRLAQPEPSSTLLSLQGDAPLGGTSSQEGPRPVTTAFPLPAFAKPRPARR